MSTNNTESSFVELDDEQQNSEFINEFELSGPEQPIIFENPIYEFLQIIIEESKIETIKKFEESEPIQPDELQKYFLIHENKCKQNIKPRTNINIYKNLILNKITETRKSKNGHLKKFTFH
jgi:hypothetical protein|uniref:Uncharacterized protein n=1 Tax=viral metagenome TaxID=1070528 RepID=A0A6C0D9E2_9ZZZZ